MNNWREEEKRLNEELYKAMGLTPRMVHYAEWGMKIFLIVFVILSSYYFALFYMDFEERGCAAYCHNLALMPNGTYNYSFIPQSELTEYTNLSSPSHSQKGAANASYYQNLG